MFLFKSLYFARRHSELGETQLKAERAERPAPRSWLREGHQSGTKVAEAFPELTRVEPNWSGNGVPRGYAILCAYVLYDAKIDRLWFTIQVFSLAYLFFQRVLIMGYCIINSNGQALEFSWPGIPAEFVTYSVQWRQVFIHLIRLYYGLLIFCIHSCFSCFVPLLPSFGCIRNLSIASAV